MSLNLQQVRHETKKVCFLRGPGLHSDDFICGLVAGTMHCQLFDCDGHLILDRSKETRLNYGYSTTNIDVTEPGIGRVARAETWFEPSNWPGHRMGIVRQSLSVPTLIPGNTVTLQIPMELELG